MTRRVAIVVIALGLTVTAIVPQPGLESPTVLPAMAEPDLGIVWSSLAQGPGVARGRAHAGLAALVSVGALVVTLLGCITFVAIAIARAAERRRDLLIRRAVGASRRFLARQALLEGAGLVTAGLALGAAFLAVAAPETVRTWSAGATPLVLPAVVAASVLLGCLFPLVLVRRLMPGANHAPAVVPLVVPSIQIGLGLLALIAGAQIHRRAPTPVGGPATAGDGMIVAIDGRQAAPILHRLRADTTIALASLSSPGTLLGLGTEDVITTECGRCTQGMIATPWRAVHATNHLASADTFTALGLPVSEGRSLRDSDHAGAKPVAVISRNLARAHFEGGRALGRAVRVGAPDRWYEVVGVVDDAVFGGIGADAQSPYHVYLSALQHQARALELLIRPAPGAPVPAALTSGVVIPERQLHADERAVAGRFARRLRWQGTVGTIIAVLGVVTVMSLWVRGLLPEIAMRRAVGARRRHVLGRVAWRGVLVVIGGAAIAWWLAPLGHEVIQQAVPGAARGDVALVRGPLALIMASALLAALVPAWAATRSVPARAGLSDL